MGKRAVVRTRRIASTTKANTGNTQEIPGIGEIGGGLPVSADSYHNHSGTRMIRRVSRILLLEAAVFGSTIARAEDGKLALDREGSFIVLEPYAPNIIRVTLSRLKEKAIASPGYGFIGMPLASDWKHEQDARGDVYKSQRLVVTVAANRAITPTADDLQLDKVFNFLSSPYARITITTPEGKTLLDMTNWSMTSPNDSDGNADILNDRR